MKRFTLVLGVGLALLVAAYAAGYGLASGPGRQLLRRETEQVLAEILKGEVRIDEVRVVLSNGIGLRGLGVRVYPTPGEPGLAAEQALIELNEAALLVGDLRLARLAVDGLVLRADLDADGRWTFPPLQYLQNRRAPAEPPSPESAPVIEVLSGAAVVGRTLLEELHIADRIELSRGEIRFEDRSLTADMRPEMAAQHFRLEGIEAWLERPWLSREAEISLSGTLSGPAGGRVPMTWRGSARDGVVEQAVTVTGLDLNVLDGYVQRLSQAADLEGSLSASVQLESPEREHARLVLVATLTGVLPTVVVDGDPVRLDLPVGQLRGRLEIEPEAVRLLDASLDGPRATFGLEGRFERPLNGESGAHLEAEIRGIELDDLGKVVDELPEASVRALREWFSRLQSAKVKRAALSGTTNLATWQALAGGDLDRLPPNFLVSLEVEDVTAELGEGDRLDDGSFEVDWADDRLEIRRGRGRWRDEELPEVTVSVDGISRFVDMQEATAPPEASPMPGLPLLLDLLLEDDEEDDDAAPEETGTRVQVEVARLDHPILRWPIRNAHVIVQPRPDGTETQITKASWGGLPVRAEVLYLLEPTPHLSVGVEARRKKREPIDDSSALAADAWAHGTFSLEPGGGTSPRRISRMSGSFALRGSEIRLDPVEMTIGAGIDATGEIRVDLAEADRLQVGFGARIRQASCDELGQVVGLPPGFITGTTRLKTEISGHIDRGADLYEGLAGSVVIRAKQGEVRRSIPLAVAIATASDGFNPFAARETLQYETIRSDLRIEGGRLYADRLELEGPVRVYATGTLDFARPPQNVEAVVGVFLLQRIRELLGKVPIVNLALPGSDKGFVGAYFRVHGPLEEPEVTTMAIKSLREELPDLIKKPVEALEWLWSFGASPGEESSDSAGSAP